MVSRASNCERRAFRGRRHDLVREPDAGDLHVRIDERRLETGLWRGVRHRHRRKPPATATPYRLPLPRQLPTLPFSATDPYRIGRNYRQDTGRAYIGTRPSKASARSIRRRVSELTASRNELLPPWVVVERLNRLLTGWANYFILGQIGPAYEAVDQHAKRWLCRKHKVRSGSYVRFPDTRLWQEYGLTRLRPRVASLPWAKA